MVHDIQTPLVSPDQLVHGKEYIARVIFRVPFSDTEYEWWIIAKAFRTNDSWWLKDRGTGYFGINDIKEIHELVLTPSLSST